MKYCFFDSDISDSNPYAEYDIIGYKYEQLIKTCCKYCCYLSLTFMNENVLLIKELEPYSVCGDCLGFDYSVNYSNGFGTKPFKKYYKVSKEVCDILIKHTDRIFSWIGNSEYNNPEDPTFYRADGTLFFYSVIHEGVCVISPNSDENIDYIISDPLWIPKSKLKDGYWDSYLKLY